MRAKIRRFHTKQTDTSAQTDYEYYVHIDDRSSRRRRMYREETYFEYMSVSYMSRAFAVSSRAQSSFSFHCRKGPMKKLFCLFCRELIVFCREFIMFCRELILILP